MSTASLDRNETVPLNRFLLIQLIQPVLKTHDKNAARRATHRVHRANRTREDTLPSPYVVVWVCLTASEVAP